MAVDLIGAEIDQATDGALGNVLDRTVGSGPAHMLDNINSVFGGDPCYFRKKADAIDQWHADIDGWIHGTMGPWSDRVEDSIASWLSSWWE
jgi:hypothetical protein